MSWIKDDVRETVQNYLWVIQQVYNQQEVLTEIKICLSPWCQAGLVVCLLYLPHLKLDVCGPEKVA